MEPGTPKSISGLEHRPNPLANLPVQATQQSAEGRFAGQSVTRLHEPSLAPVLPAAAEPGSERLTAPLEERSLGANATSVAKEVMPPPEKTETLSGTSEYANEQVRECCQKWRMIRSEFPHEVTFNQLVKLMNQFKAALTSRSAATGDEATGKVQSDAQTTIDCFLSGTLAMAAKRILKMPEQILKPDWFPTDETNCRTMFGEHHTAKLFQSMTDTLHLEASDITISSSGNTFFYPGDPFRTSYITENFIETLLTTLSEYYHPCPALTVDNPSEEPSLIRLLELLGLWIKKDDQFIVLNIRPKNGEISPYNLITAFKNGLTETHPLYQTLSRVTLLNMEAVPVLPTVQSQAANLGLFQQQLFQSLSNLRSAGNND